MIAKDMTIRIGGILENFAVPKVMGIVNVTPDSFFAGSRTPGLDEMERRVREMYATGVDWLDVGGYSSRPGCADISAEEEYSRLAPALERIRAIREDAVISVDTFRAGVARRCVNEWGVQIINDISGGTLDDEMFATVAELKVAYVLMHLRGTPQTMTSLTHYDDITAEVVSDLAFKLDRLHDLGVADVMIDPGFGFAKDTDGNFRLLAELDAFRTLGCPVLAGISRKTMIWRTLGVTPAESLNGTTALNMAALMKGADILRVHDVAEASECVKLYQKLKENA